MAATSSAKHVVIVEPDARVRHALAGLLASAADLEVRAACATVGDAELFCCSGAADVALVSVRRGSDASFAAVSRLAQHVPVTAVAPVGSVAGRAIAAGAVAFYDEDGDADALVGVIRDVINRGVR